MQTVSSLKSGGTDFKINNDLVRVSGGTDFKINNDLVRVSRQI